MKTVIPNYYPQFFCLADRCRHTCCAGWEIAVDAETAARYRAVPYAFGERLRQSLVQTGDGVIFRMTADNRCPFLAENGLCIIYQTLGADALCRICRDHPRFRNFFSDRVELGLGLCCEAAASLILSAKTPFALESRTEDGAAASPTETEQAFFALRADLFSLVQNAALPLAERCTALCARVGARRPSADFPRWHRLYAELEQCSGQWAAVCSRLQKANADLQTVSPEAVPVLENLLCAFLYRHLAGALSDGKLAERILFSVHAAELLWALYAVDAPPTAAFDLARFADLVRQYSTEIEYSDENLHAVLDALSADC